MAGEISPALPSLSSAVHRRGQCLEGQIQNERQTKTVLRGQKGSATYRGRFLRVSSNLRIWCLECLGLLARSTSTQNNIT